MKAEELADWDVANIWFGKLIEKNLLPMYFSWFSSFILWFFHSKAFHVVIAITLI